MGAPATKTLMTAEEFDNFPFEEDKRYELDEGEMIEMTRPAFLHNYVLVGLTANLYNYFKSNKLGMVLNSENLFALSPSIRRAPDLAVILGSRYEELKNAKVIPIIPEIAVEVLSPSETPRMIHRKLKQYFAAGVKEVWLIDPDVKEVEIWPAAGPSFQQLTGTEVLSSPLLPGFALPLPDLFA